MAEHRAVLHVDINAFFASVEQQANPELMGKRIAVVRGNGRTVITTASYEAREFEVKTGMAIIGQHKALGTAVSNHNPNRRLANLTTRLAGAEN